MSNLPLSTPDQPTDNIFRNVSIVIPAFNEAASIARVVKKTLDATGGQAEVVVVDDGSHDGTAELAERAGARVVRHEVNKGNGAAVKTGARQATREIVVFLDADGQHSPESLEAMVRMIGPYDLVIGSRNFRNDGAFHRNWANRFFNALASHLAEYKILDLTSGFRAFKRRLLLNYLYLLPNRFSYPTTSTLAFIKTGHNVGFMPINVSKRVGRSKIKIFRDGVRFLIIIFKIIVIFHPLKVFAPTSAALFLLGIISSIIGTFSKGHIYLPNSADILFVSALLTLLMGLISEQISAMRLEIIEREERRNEPRD